MKYYEVLPADNSYKRSEALTYASTVALNIGTVVQIPLKNTTVNGVILRSVTKPSFATKDLTVPDNPVHLPRQVLQLAQWIASYYAVGIGTVMQLCIPQKLPKQSENKPAEAPPPMRASALLPPLTRVQQAALQQIGTHGSHILHGDTGSGKTRIYIELALRAFKNGASSIILTPEIGLTPQLSQQFEQAFGVSSVITIHSRLSALRRRELWARIAMSRRPLIIIGPRSALFSPVQNLGLVVIDEAHESAYKHEQAPYYQTSAVAAQLVALHQACLVLGSATPRIDEYYYMTRKQRPIVRMEGAARSSTFSKPTLQVIDLKDRSLFERQPHISQPLIEAISDALQKNEQSLIFLNRRGTARVVLCTRCAWQAVCSICDLPLTYHGDTHHMRCHTCGFTASAPANCPACGSTDIAYKSVGTKAIFGELQALFPAANIQRFDKDNAQHERLEAHYDAVQAGKLDILVGTQLITKGLDLPKLSVVGVIAADTSLSFPDYTAEERTYQMLHQVIGRVGRGHRAGSVIVQTYQPANDTIKHAIDDRWDSFYHAQLQERRTFTFPPYCFLLKLTCRRSSAKSAQTAAKKLATHLRERFPSLLVEGPAPSFHEKHGTTYQWQLIIKATQRTHLLTLIKDLPSTWSYDIDPSNLL